MRIIACLFIAFLSANASAAPHGDELYARHCSSCHGNDGKGGVGVPLALPSFLDSVSDEYLEKTIRHGRPGRIMPAFDVLSDAQLTAVVKHLRSWSDKPAPKEDNSVIKGNAKKGKVLFAKYCMQCHGEDGSGGKGTGVTFSRKRDLPIIAPALNNAGFLASATDVMLRDTITYGREGTPMTSMLVAGLTETDIDDIVSYIRSMEEAAERSKQALNGNGSDSPVIMVDSPYDLDETVANLKQAITDQNFTLIRTEYLEHGLVEEGKENKKQVALHFCNFGFLFKALSVDPRVGMFLPCRVTVIENDGKVQVSTINPKRLGKLFNNHELDEYCDEMYEVYSTLLEDATL
ncbi:MAG: c-type cytochrome [Gammaproteobacteria bacterium]|nr:c-type cytochrome [Gammaproteobacteria bacterium]